MRARGKGKRGRGRVRTDFRKGLDTLQDIWVVLWEVFGRCCVIFRLHRSVL